MTSMYDANGRNVAVTIIDASPCVVTQVRDEETDGYRALQVGFGERKEKNTPKALMGHFAKANTTPKSKVVELRNSTLAKSLGDTITISDVLQEGDEVSVVGISKGKGFQGVVKRHGFAGVGQATHGQHNRGRAPGSIGQSSTPSKVFKGMRMGGQMGNVRVKVRHLKVMKVFAEQNLILVKGAVPGHKGAFVVIEK